MRRSILFVLTIFTLSAHATTVYEGWHKVLSAGQHVGYYVMKYERDAKTNRFFYTSFLKTNALGNDVTEALKAESIQVEKPEQWIVPVKYQYTSTQGKSVTLIDAVFEAEKAKKGEEKSKLRMVASITKDGKTTKHDEVLSDKVFLSSYLTYIILQSKEGLKVGNNYKYTAIAEEEAKAYDGTAFVKELVKEGGKDAYKIVNEFKGIRFISTISPRGEVLSTKSPLLSIATEPAQTMEEAVGKVKLDEKNIRTLFGQIPGVKK